MNWDKDIQNSLDAHLSGLHVSERQQAQMFNRIVRGEQIGRASCRERV